MMIAAVQLLTFPNEAPPPGLAPMLAQAVLDSETAEQGLAIDCSRSNIDERLSTGSFYTPADVAEHFWDEYFRFHDITTIFALRCHLAEFTFIEPAVGAGIFLFSLMQKVVTYGCELKDLSGLRFVAVDLNRSALEFIAERLKTIEAECGCRFDHITLHEADFCRIKLPYGCKFSFVGNPPYVKNQAGAQWKNLYADFLVRMLEIPAEQRNVSLIIPVSIAFSRDYSRLRDKIRNLCKAIRLESFDNIPDSLFTTGKPGSRNSNKANSQRCSILFLRDHGLPLRDASSMQRWSRKARFVFLKSEPNYVDISTYSLDGQFPRPSCDWIINYLGSSDDAFPLGDLVREGKHAFAVSSVGRNFIGLREPATPEPSSMPLTFPSEAQMLWALQILGSPIFYEYWRTIGDGFHITRSDILRFPISPHLLDVCVKGEASAKNVWRKRATFERTKLNSGREVNSYDFRGQFDNLLESVKVQPVERRAKVSANGVVLSFQPSFLGLLAN